MGAAWFVVWGCVLAFAWMFVHWRMRTNAPLARFIESAQEVDSIVIVSDADGRIAYMSSAAESRVIRPTRPTTITPSTWFINGIESATSEVGGVSTITTS